MKRPWMRNPLYKIDEWFGPDGEHRHEGRTVWRDIPTISIGADGAICVPDDRGPVVDSDGDRSRRGGLGGW